MCAPSPFSSCPWDVTSSAGSRVLLIISIAVRYHLRQSQAKFGQSWHTSEIHVSADPQMLDTPQADKVPFCQALGVPSFGQPKSPSAAALSHHDTSASSLVAGLESLVLDASDRFSRHGFKRVKSWKVLKAMQFHSVASESTVTFCKGLTLGVFKLGEATKWTQAASTGFCRGSISNVQRRSVQHRTPCAVQTLHHHEFHGVPCIGCSGPIAQVVLKSFSTLSQIPPLHLPSASWQAIHSLQIEKSLASRNRHCQGGPLQPNECIPEHLQKCERHRKSSNHRLLSSQLHRQLWWLAASLWLPPGWHLQVSYQWKSSESQLHAEGHPRQTSGWDPSSSTHLLRWCW